MDRRWSRIVSLNYCTVNASEIERSQAAYTVWQEAMGLLEAIEAKEKQKS